MPTGQPTSDMQAVLDTFAKLNPPRIETLNPNAARNAPTFKNAAEEMQAESITARTFALASPMPPPVGRIEHITIPTANGDLLARVFTPKGDAPFPVVVYFHGGGWVIANLDVYEPSCRALCNAAEAIVVSVAYRQAPEFKYPAAADDAYAATQWVIANAARLGGDPSRVAVAGESAGGNLATVTCLRARDEGGRMPVAQLLVYPVTDARQNTASYAENANSKPLNSAMMSWFWSHYLESEAQGREPYASPAMAESLRDLPPAIVLTAEIDPLRDEGAAYAKRLADEGVSVDYKHFDGVTHEFFGLAGVVSAATEAVGEAAKGLKKAFEASARR